MYDVQCFLIIISTIKFIVYEIIFDVDAHVVWMKKPTICSCEKCVYVKL